MCDYQKLSFVHWGEGENVLLLHGWDSNKLAWGNLLDLRDDYHVWSLDLWGFGDSLPPSMGVGSADYAHGVADFIEYKIGSKVKLICHSFGGRVGLNLASSSDLVEKLVLIDSAGVPPRFSFRRWLNTLRYRVVKRQVALGKEKAESLDSFGSSDYRAAKGIMRSVLVRSVNENLVPIARNIRVPTQIVWGKYDSATPLYMAKTLRKVIKNSRLDIVSGGHFCFLDTNILPILYNFLERRDGRIF